jgi:hypothetical protein
MTLTFFLVFAGGVAVGVCLGILLWTLAGK